MKRARFIAIALLVGVLFITGFLLLQDSLTEPISHFHPPFSGMQIPRGGISPNGQFAFVLRPGEFTDSGLSTSGHNEENYLLNRTQPSEYLYVPTLIINLNDQPTGMFHEGTVKWARNSTSVLGYQFGPSDIYAVPIINGKPGKLIDMLYEILKVSHRDFVKAHAQEMEEASYHDASYQYGGISDQGADDLTFNDSNQIVIDCLCGNIVPDRSLVGTIVHVTGLYDPIQGKFVKVSVSPK